MKEVARMASQHEQIVEAFEAYIAESESFEERGIKASATRARKALGDLGKLAKLRRAEIQDKKNSM
jgi:N-glycosylase/DNA lyase